MTTATAATDFRQPFQRIESLIHRIDEIPDPETRTLHRELLQTVLDLHGAALGRLLDLLAECTGGPGMIGTLAADEQVSSLLLLYGMHPLDLESRVRQALDDVRPMLASHQADVELLGIADGHVRVRLERQHAGCASTGPKLQQAVEEAIYARAPDVASIAIEGLEETNGAGSFVPLGELRVREKESATVAAG